MESLEWRTPHRRRQVQRYAMLDEQTRVAELVLLEKTYFAVQRKGKSGWSARGRYFKTLEEALAQAEALRSRQPPQAEDRIHRALSLIGSRQALDWFGGLSAAERGGWVERIFRAQLDPRNPTGSEAPARAGAKRKNS